MKPQSTQRLSAFIIALIIFSAIPAFVNAQKKCPKGHCPKGYVCVNGYCVKSSPPCTCVRPIPPGCVDYCVWQTTGNKSFFIDSAKSNAISFQLMQAQNVSAKIYDATGRLIKTIADNKMREGYHQIEWGAKDETGNAVQAGVYVLRIKSGNYSEDKKILIAK